MERLDPVLAVVIGFLILVPACSYWAVHPLVTRTEYRVTGSLTDYTSRSRTVYEDTDLSVLLHMLASIVALVGLILLVTGTYRLVPKQSDSD